MPRAKDVVTKIYSKNDLHKATIQKTIKLHRPYEVVAGELCGEDAELYGIVYTAPRGGERKVVATREVRANATSLRDLLSEAWAEGAWSLNRE